MNKERVLVALVAADVLLVFTVIGAELAFYWTLPGSLQDYAFPQAFSPSSPWELSLFVLWAATVACTMAAWIGLLNFWWFARRLYLVAWGTWVLLVLLSGPSVMTPVGAMLDTLDSIVGGAIVGLVYFSDLSRCFERRVGEPCTAEI